MVVLGIVLGIVLWAVPSATGPCAVASGNSCEGSFVPLSSLMSSTAASIVAGRTRRGPASANEIGQLLMAHSCNTPAVAIALARRPFAGCSQVPAGLTLGVKPPKPSPNTPWAR
jgi:hypothetical protein